MREREKERKSGREKERECQMQLCFVAILSQRECVGTVIKCAHQLCDKGKECAGMSQCPVFCATQKLPSAWAHSFGLCLTTRPCRTNTCVMSAAHVMTLECPQLLRTLHDFRRGDRVIALVDHVLQLIHDRDSVTLCSRHRTSSQPTLPLLLLLLYGMATCRPQPRFLLS